MSDTAQLVTLPHYGTTTFDLARLNEALTAVVAHETEEAGRYALVHTHGWPATDAVAYARAAQFCCDNIIDPNEHARAVEPAPAGSTDDHADVVLHFLADQREAAREGS